MFSPHAPFCINQIVGHAFVADVEEMWLYINYNNFCGYICPVNFILDCFRATAMLPLIK